MKILTFLVTLTVAMGLKAATLDGIAAKINGNAVTVGDVMAEIRRNPAARAKFAAGNDEAEMNAVYVAALDSLINRKLILAAAADKKVEMQEWVVDNRVREILKDGFGGDKNKLEALLMEQHIPFAEWRNTIREDLILAAMRFQIVEKNISPSPAEMRAEYTTHKARYGTDAKVSVSVILLKPVDDGKTPSVTTRGIEILEKLDKGENFAKLARENSADSHAANGGLWQDVNAEEAFRSEIAAEIGRLKVGEYSKLIDLDGWGFIIRKEAESAATQKTFAEAYDDILKNVRNAQMKKAYDAWIARLRAAANIKINPMPTK